MTIYSQSEKRLKAITLRKKGYTYEEIIKKIHIAKSTLSDWVNAEIDKDEEQKIKQRTAKKGLKKTILFNKLRSKKIQDIEKNTQLKYARDIKKIDKDALFWIGMGLYMAEGAKTGRWKAVFYNSDPLLNQIMKYFFRKICCCPEDRLHVQMILHPNITEEKAKDYWSRILKIRKNMFNRASYIISKASKGKRPKNSLPFGTVQLAVGNKEVLNKIKGWTIGIQNQIEKMNSL